MYQMEESRNTTDISKNPIQNKDKNDVAHIPSGKKFKFADIKLSGMIENISQTRGKIHPFDNANCVQRKEGKCSEGMHDGVLQMERKEAVKLVASSFGKCPFTEIALTVHHIIPDELIAQFYEKVKGIKVVQKEFHDWQNAAKEVEAEDEGMSQTADEGMSPTEIQSQQKDAKRTKKAKTAEEVQESYCHWMYGNVFIGPDSALRIDDKGAKFDEGAYLDGDEQLNGEVDNLKVLYDDMRRFVDDETMDAEELKGILNRLTNVAKRNTTLHNDLTKTDLPTDKKFAYDVRMWMNVGEAIADDKINEEIRRDFVQKPAEIEKWKKIILVITRIEKYTDRIQKMNDSANRLRNEFDQFIDEFVADTNAEVDRIEEEENDKEKNDKEKIDGIKKKLLEVQKCKEPFHVTIDKFIGECGEIEIVKAASEETVFSQTYNELLDNGKIEDKQGPLFISLRNYNILNALYMKIQSADIGDREPDFTTLERNVTMKEEELKEMRKFKEYCNKTYNIQLDTLMSEIKSSIDSMRDFSGFGDMFQF